MKKKTSIFGIILMLGLAFAPVTGALANDDNNLVQLDIKKSNNNAVDVTFFTTNPYSDNIVVRKKSDNKYVILMPKVLTSGYSTPDLNGVKDVITHVDVKSLNDAGNGYTKVTLITTKPVNIKTRTQKSAPVTAEQQEVKTLIQQANAIKPDSIRKSEPPKAAVPQKTAITVNKASSPKEVKNSAKETPKIQLSEVNPQTLVKESTVKADNKKADKIKGKFQNQAKDLKETIVQKTQEKTSEVISKNTPDIVPESVPVPIVNNKNELDNIKDIKDLKTEKPAGITLMSKVKNKLKTFKKEVESRMPVNIPSFITFIVIPLFGLTILIKLIKASVQKSKALKEAFVEHLAQKPPMLNTVKYNNIVNNKDLTWQQKYQRFLDESSRPAPRGQQGHYAFITKPVSPDEIEQKRRDLEQLVTDMSENQSSSDLPEIVEVHSEDNVISDELSKTVKLKAFSKPKSLEETSRDRISPRFKKFEIEKPEQEQENVSLGSSALHSNPRKSTNQNLKVTDLKGSGKNRGSKMNVKENDYIMSSLDEYFSILEQEETQTPTLARTSNPIASSLSKIKPSMHSKEAQNAQQLNKQLSTPINKQTSNPISKLRGETKQDYINGLIVKSGFNIDENRGFYIVNLDGASALVGRVKEEIFVLKKFDKNVDKPLQVRHDNNNVYMVKTEGFKSLVEVGEEKMGVLIEL